MPIEEYDPHFNYWTGTDGRTHAAKRGQVDPQTLCNTGRAFKDDSFPTVGDLCYECFILSQELVFEARLARLRKGF